MSRHYDASQEPDRRKICRKCKGRGLLAVRDRTDRHVWGIAICDCPGAAQLRRYPDAVVAYNSWIRPEWHVGFLEDFEDQKPVRGEVYKG